MNLDPDEFGILRQTRLFAHLDAVMIERLLQGSMVRGYPRGKVLFQQGDEAIAFYIVIDGWVKLYRESIQGGEAVFGVLTRGEAFAEAAMFLGGEYPVSAQIVEDSRLLPVLATTFRSRLLDKPEICMSMLASMSQHLHSFVAQVEQLQTRSSAQRLAQFLISLSPVETGSAVIALPYDKSLIAARLGMKPESLSRALSRLRLHGVSSDGNRVVINSVRELSDYCESGPLRERIADH
jgi:CRP-like cAMP-binding protein